MLILLPSVNERTGARFASEILKLPLYVRPIGIITPDLNDFSLKKKLTGRLNPFLLLWTLLFPLLRYPFRNDAKLN